MKTTVALLTVTLLLLSGCAVVDAYKLANDTIFDPADLGVTVTEHDTHYKRPDDSIGALYINWYSNRVSESMSMSGIYIYVNGVRAGAVTSDAYTVLDLKPGIYDVAVGDKNNQDETKKIQIEKGQNLYYSTGIEANLIRPDSLFFTKNNDIDDVKKRISKSKYVTLDAS